jgi:hypothetical protein
MDQKDVFALALGLAGTPWTVVGVRFDPELKRLDIEVDFPPGSRFPHPDTGQASPVYDSEPRSWRHMNFFQFECYVKAHVPRVDGGPGSGAQRAEILAAFDQSGVSAAEFARLVGVKYPTLAGWLHRRGRPRGAGDKSGGDALGANLRSQGYTVDDLNLYTTRTNLRYLEVQGTVHATGKFSSFENSSAQEVDTKTDTNRANVGGGRACWS